MQQSGQLLAIGDGQRGGGQVLQDLLRVISAAEEGAVQPRPHPAVHLRCPREEQHAEGRADRNRRSRSRREAPRERLPKPQRDTDGKNQDQNGKAALHQKVARAAPQQHGNVHHAMLNDGVSERQRQQKRNTALAKPSQKGVSV